MNPFLEFIPEPTFQNLFRKLISTGKSQGSNLRSITEQFGDPHSLSKVYIQPDCQFINPSDIDSANPYAEVRSPAIKTVFTFCSGRFPQQQTGRAHLLILGEAGMGKTSLLVILKLLHLTKSWPSGLNCELLRIDQDTIPKMKKIWSPKSTILLLDALDEDSAAVISAHDRLAELFGATTDFLRVIITSRTQFVQSSDIASRLTEGLIQIKNYRSPVIFLSSFNDEQVDQYLRRRFPKSSFGVFSNRRHRKALAQAKETIDNLGSLSRCPLILSNIDKLVGVERSEWTEFDAYERLVDLWIQNEVRELDSLQNIRMDYSTLETLYITLAIAIQSDSTRTIPLEGQDIPIKNTAIITQQGALKPKSSYLIAKDSKGHYRFTHYTIQEFFLAKHLVHAGDDLRVRNLVITNKILDFVEMFLERSENTEGKGVSFEHCDFTGLKLVNRDFENICLSRSRFVSCKLQRCSFNCSEMVSVDLSNSSLNECSFDNANVTNSCFERAILRKVSMKGLIAPNTQFKHAQLVICTFSGGNFENADFSRSVLMNSRFCESNFCSSNWDNTEFLGSSFFECRFDESKNLKKQDSQTALRGRLPRFQDLTALDSPALSKILCNIDLTDLVVCLNQVSESMKQIFLGCLPERAAEDVYEKIQLMEPTKQRDIARSEKRIIARVRKLESKKEIDDLGLTEGSSFNQCTFLNTKFVEPSSESDILSQETIEELVAQVANEQRNR